jgi:hypothetical protein
VAILRAKVTRALTSFLLLAAEVIASVSDSVAPIGRNPNDFPATTPAAAGASVAPRHRVGRPAVRRFQRWLRCWRRTFGAHELDFANGRCRICGRDVREPYAESSRPGRGVERDAAHDSVDAPHRGVMDGPPTTGPVETSWETAAT